MSDKVGSFAGPKSQRSLWPALLAAASGFGVWYVLGGTNDWRLIVAAIGITTLVLELTSRWVINRSAKTLQEINDALSHVATDPTHSGPPIPSSALAKKLVRQIYDLASNSRDLTSTIEEDRILLNSVLNLLPVSVWVFNKSQELVLANDTAHRLLGTKPQSLKGLAVPKVLDWLFQTDQTYDVWLEQVRQSKVRDVRIWERVSLLSKDNQRLIGDVAVHYEKSQSSGIETIVIFLNRTTEYTADEAELDFVAVAAHELRGPITVIRGYLDVFNQELKGVLNVEQRALLQKMAVSAEMLSLYVNNILNVARLDQQSMPLHIRESDWREVLKEAYADLFLRAEVRGRTLKLVVPNELSTVAVDRVSIIEVINNLVDNAIKYSPEGGEIVLKAEEHEGLVSTTIEDRGIGIPEAVIGNLFQKFYRSHRSRHGVSGTGLGLYLCKAILDGHGGNIWVRSQVGEGSTFGFDLPTYASIADTLKKGDDGADAIKHSSRGWIKNHAMYRR